MKLFENYWISRNEPCPCGSGRKYGIGGHRGRTTRRHWTWTGAWTGSSWSSCGVL